MVNVSDAAAEEEEVRLKAEAFFWFEGFLLPICGTIGIVGNVLCILVLKMRDLDLKASFANLGRQAERFYVEALCRIGRS